MVGWSRLVLACKRLMVADRFKHQPQSKSAMAMCGTGLARQLHKGNLAALYVCLCLQSQYDLPNLLVGWSRLVLACKRLMVADRFKHQPQSKSAIAMCGTGLARQLHKGNLAALYMCLCLQSQYNLRNLLVGWSRLVLACKRLMVADRFKHQPQSKSAMPMCGTGLARQLHKGNLAALYMCLCL